MNNIEIIIRRNCEACLIMMHNMADVLDEVNTEISVKVIVVSSVNIDMLSELNIKSYPTLIIKRDNKEIGRLEGTFSKEYLIEVINKIN